MESVSITGLLDAWSAGKEGACEALVSAVYDELHDLAERVSRGTFRTDTLGPTGLVHELHLRLTRIRRVDWRSRAHFFALASGVMRNVLVDRARAREAAKRGGGDSTISLDEQAARAEAEEVDETVVALHHALSRFAEDHPRAAQVVEMRFFGGMTAAEMAEVLDVAPMTVHRDWQLARKWLGDALGEDDHVA